MSAAPTIVLVHGLCVTQDARRTFVGVEAALTARGHPVRRPIVQGDGTLEQLADRLWAQLHAIDGPLVLVCHSMGGLEARTFLLDDARARRLRAIATLGSPHAGTPLAHAMAPFQRACRDLTPSARAAWHASHAAAETASAERHAIHLLSGVAALRAPAVHRRLQLTQRFLQRLAGPNDGLVSAASQRFGEVVLEVSLDHVACAAQAAEAKTAQEAVEAWVRLAEAAGAPEA